MERANGSNHGGKKMSIITGFSMFFLSFFPLWISVLFLDIKSICEGNPNIRTEAISVLLILIVSIISLIILMLEFNPKNMQGSQEYSIITAIEEKTITADFLLSYILPLFAFDFTVWSEVVLFLVFFFVFAFLSIRHSHFSVNILLELMNYRFYSCELKNEDGISISKTVICQKILSARIGETILVRPINNEYAVKLYEEKQH